MSDHTCKTLTAGCYRCSLNMHELVGAAEMERDEARALARDACRYIKVLTQGFAPTDWDTQDERAEVELILARAKEAGML